MSKQHFLPPNLQTEWTFQKHAYPEDSEKHRQNPCPLGHFLASSESQVLRIVVNEKKKWMTHRWAWRSLALSKVRMFDSNTSVWPNSYSYFLLFVSFFKQRQLYWTFGVSFSFCPSLWPWLVWGLELLPDTERRSYWCSIGQPWECQSGGEADAKRA